MKKQYTVEELTCPECGFVAVNANGLRGHRQFKHGVRPSGAQLPLQKQDLLVSESKLAQLLDERLGIISEQVNELSGELDQQANALEQLKELQVRLDAAERKTIDDFTPIEKAQFIIPWMKELNGEDFVKLSLKTGHDAQLVEVPDPKAQAEIAEFFRQQAEEQKEAENPKIIHGKTDKPGYIYYDYLNVSMREK